MWQVLLNLLYYYGTCGLVKESLLQRYFSTVLFPLSVGILFSFYIHIGKQFTLKALDGVCRKFVGMDKILNQRSCKPVEVLVLQL
jgi:hypothetical protein